MATDLTLDYGNTAPPPSAGGRFAAVALVLSFASWTAMVLWVLAEDRQSQAPSSEYGDVTLEAIIFSILGTLSLGTAIVALVRTARRGGGTGYGVAMTMATIAVVVSAPLFFVGLFWLWFAFVR